MRLVTFEHDRMARLGALIDGDATVVDLDRAHSMATKRHDPSLASMLALIEGGDEALVLARQTLAFADGRRPPGAVLPATQVRLLAPLPRPTQLRDGLFFEKHLQQAFAASRRLKARRDPAQAGQPPKEGGSFAIPPIWYERPLYYKSNRMSVIGPGADIHWPAYCELLDYELEFACVIGRPTKDAHRDQARRAIFGYTIFNDVSARDTQVIEMPGMLGPTKCKDFDTGNVLGPCLVTADEIPDPYNLVMTARVNGQEWSRGTSATMHWKFEDAIATITQSETLYPGEVIGSGTVGDGCGLEQDRFLKPGDIVELEVEKIGVLRNRIVKP